MRVTCIQMDMQLGKPEENFAHGEDLIRQAVKDDPDVLVLPETWNTGFFPKDDLKSLADSDGKAVKTRIGALAKRYGVNIVAGSVANVKNGKVYNTAYVFDRQGNCIASYDKTHLFTPMGEDSSFEKGDHLCRFTLDGVSCGLIICYDIRFPELIRSLTVPGLDMLFMVSQWPDVRTSHLRSLTTARAIENQMFVVCCDACGTAGDKVCGGGSAVFGPTGKILAEAGDTQQIITADCDLDGLQNLRNSFPVFRDRRPELYRL